MSVSFLSYAAVAAPPSSKYVVIAVIGPDIPSGVVDSLRREPIEIALSIEAHLGFPTPQAAGKVLPWARSKK
jgi:hypothetical protein